MAIKFLNQLDLTVTSSLLKTDANGVIVAAVAGTDYLSTLPAHTHDDRYYTETESDARFLRKDADTTLTGTLFVDAVNGGSIAYSDPVGVYIPRPQGASYKTTTDAHTGAITVRLPGSIPADMISFWVDVYDYAGNPEGESFSVYVYGYAYQTVTPWWTNVGALILSDRTDKSFTVRFGWDGTNHVVCIGETNSTWNYPQVVVRDFQAGYAADSSTFDDNWSIAFLTTLPSIGQTASNNYPVARSAFQLSTARSINGTNFDGTANITTANWGTARTITIGATGKSVNGSGNVSWTLGELQAEYQVPTNTIRNNLGDPTVREMALFHGQFNNKFRFIAPTLQEQSTDGTTWVASSRATAAQLGDMMIGEGQGTGFDAIPSGTVGTYGAYRLTWNVVGNTGYVFLNALYIYSSASGNNIGVTIERFHNTTGWETVTGPHTISNWPGHAYIPHTSIPYSNSATQYSQVRVTFTSTHNANTNAFTLYAMEWFGGYPQGRRNAEYYDRDKNVYFPAYVNGSRMVTSAVMASGTGGLAFKTSDGSDRMFLNNSGNFGIGTTSPSTRLEVLGDTEVITIRTSYPANLSQRGGLLWKDATNITGAIDTRYDGTTVDMYFGSLYNSGYNSTTRMVIKGNGNVGIGTTAPGVKLDVNGAIRATAGDSSGLRVHTNSGITASNNYMNFFTGQSNGWSFNTNGTGADSDSKVVITAAGNVGIGTTSPSYKLDISTSQSIRVVGSSNGYTQGSIIFQSSTTNSPEARGLGVYLFNEGTDATWFYGTGYGAGDTFLINRKSGATYQDSAAAPAESSNFFAITNAGNVGIGTISPGRKLHVENASGVGEAVISGTTGATLYFRPNTQYSAAGNFGIFTTGLTSGTFESTMTIKGYSSAVTDVMTIKGSGNVGIGTTSPVAALHVQSAATKLFLSNTDFNTSTSTGSGLILHTGASSGNTYGQIYAFQSGNTSYANLVVPGGNVGIGTTSPIYKLDVNVASNSDALRVQQAGASKFILNGDGVMTWGASAANGVLTWDNNIAYIGGLTNNALGIWAGGSEKVRITTGGNVGIGTTSPAQRLHVAGTGQFGDYALIGTSIPAGFYMDALNGAFRANGTSGDKGFYFQSYNGSNSYMYVGLNGSYAGNVGIGTIAPAVKLEIKTNTSDTTSVEGLRIYNAGGSVGAGVKIGLGVGATYTEKGYIRTDIVSGGAGRMFFGVNGGDVITINNSSNVGIGTTSPAYKLDVAGEGKVTGKFRVGGAVMLAEPGTGVLLFGSEGGDQTAIYSASLERIRINISGNVGIGTTSPSERLDVSGNARTSGFVLVNNHSDNTLGYRISNTSGTAVSAMFVNSSNQLVIAAGAVDQVNLNKKVLVNGVALGVNVAPSATAGRIDASNDIVAYSSSDERLKQNITPIENALDKVKSLTGVEFDWKPEYKDAHGYEGHDTGVIAQQVEAVIPSAVRTNDTGFLAVRYEKLIGLLIEGMKEQQAQIDELKAKLDGLTK